MTMTRAMRLGLLTSAGLALATCPRGLADGCMMPLVGEATNLVASARQEALLATDGRRVQVVLRTHFRRGPRELAWVVPVPARPDAVEEAPGELFAELNAVAAPRFYLPGAKGGGIGCGCAMGARESQIADGAVTVEATGRAGIFEYVVLSARDAAELTGWLNENKYLVPVGAERVFERYVKGGWHWLAMRVRSEAAEKPTLAPHPVSYTYRDDKLVYPLVVSQLSADVENEIVLYVVGEARFACANWANGTIAGGSLMAQANSPSGTNYEELFRSATAEHGGHLFVTEYAQEQRLFGRPEGRGGPFDDTVSASLLEGIGQRQTLTRLRAVMTAGAMDRDVVLVPVAGWAPVQNGFTVASAGRGAPPPALAAAALALGALWAGVCLLSRPRAWRLVGGAAVAAACLVLAMV